MMDTMPPFLYPHSFLLCLDCIFITCLKLFLIHFMYMSVCVCVYHMCVVTTAFRIQKTVSGARDSMELELQMVVSLHAGAAN